MDIRPSQTKDWKQLALVIASVLLVSLVVMPGCSSLPIPEIEIYPSIELRPNLHHRTSASKETIEWLLSEVWISGFLAQTESVREEILNNDYGVFREEGELPQELNAKAYYLREKGRNDRVMLSRYLFRGFQIHPDLGMCRRSMDKSTAATLVHELFHDFWFNLLEKGARKRFHDEAKKLVLESGFIPLPEILAYREDYSEEKLYGTEMYALVAELAYTGDLKIPPSLLPFYQGILSQQTLTTMKSQH